MKKLPAIKLLAHPLFFREFLGLGLSFFIAAILEITLNANKALVPLSYFFNAFVFLLFAIPLGNFFLAIYSILTVKHEILKINISEFINIQSNEFHFQDLTFNKTQIDFLKSMANNTKNLNFYYVKIKYNKFFKYSLFSLSSCFIPYYKSSRHLNIVNGGEIWICIEDNINSISFNKFYNKFTSYNWSISQIKNLILNHEMGHLFFLQNRPDSYLFNNLYLQKDTSKTEKTNNTFFSSKITASIAEKVKSFDNLKPKEESFLIDKTINTANIIADNNYIKNRAIFNFNDLDKTLIKDELVADIYSIFETFNIDEIPSKILQLANIRKNYNKIFISAQHQTSQALINVFLSQKLAKNLIKYKTCDDKNIKEAIILDLIS